MKTRLIVALLLSGVATGANGQTVLSSPLPSTQTLANKNWDGARLTISSPGTYVVSYTGNLQLAHSDDHPHLTASLRIVDLNDGRPYAASRFLLKHHGTNQIVPVFVEGLVTVSAQDSVTLGIQVVTDRTTRVTLYNDLNISSPVYSPGLFKATKIR